MLGRITREAEKLTINGSGIEGIQSSESFIEMKSQTKAMPYMPSKDSD